MAKLNIINDQVAGLPRIGWAKGKPTMIVLHDTANPNSTVAGERAYMARNYKNAFYHAIAGEDGLHVLHDPSKGGAWGAGHHTHNYAIHIELIHSKTKDGFNKAYTQYVEGAKYYAKKYGIPIKFNSGRDKTGIVTHRYVTNTWGGTTHLDPDAYLAKWGVSISQLAKDIGASKGSVNSSKTPKPSGKSISKMADEVIAGKHGSGNETRRKSLGISKAEYEKVRAEVNRRLGGGSSSSVSKPKPVSKSVTTMAKEVIAGKHGSGHANRRKSLGVSQATYDKVRAEVNRLSGVKTTTKPKGKSVKQMADEIIRGKGIPNGHEARRKYFGISQATYNKVRAEVNKRL